MNPLDGKTSFHLVSAQRHRSSGALEAQYTLRHATPGESGTVLELQVLMKSCFDITEATLVEESATGSTPDEALDKLANWLERAALAIRNRKPGVLPGT